MSLLHTIEDKNRWSDRKSKCAYIEFMLKRCKKEQNVCTPYEQALEECKLQKWHRIFSPPFSAQGVTTLSSFFVDSTPKSTGDGPQETQ